VQFQQNHNGSESESCKKLEILLKTSGPSQVSLDIQDFHCLCYFALCGKKRTYVLWSSLLKSWQYRL